MPKTFRDEKEKYIDILQTFTLYSTVLDQMLFFIAL